MAMQRIMISLDPETYDQFAQDAEANGLRLSTYLRMRLTQLKEADNAKDKGKASSNSRAE